MSHKEPQTFIFIAFRLITSRVVSIRLMAFGKITETNEDEYNVNQAAVARGQGFCTSLNLI